MSRQSVRDTAPVSRRERRAAERLERAPRARSHRRESPRPAWRSPFVLVSVAALALGAALVAVSLPKPPPARGELTAPRISYTGATIDGETLGAADAPVTIELYSDFQCPACRMFVTEQLQRLVTEFVVPGTARIEAKDIDILGTGNPSESMELAVGAACAAEQGRYWQFHDYVFWNQGHENRGDHDATFIAGVADHSAVPDLDAWAACVARDEHREAVRATTSAGLAAGISSTPTLVVNGQKIVGVPNYDQLAALIRSLAPTPS